MTRSSLDMRAYRSTSMAATSGSGSTAMITVDAMGSRVV